VRRGPASPHSSAFPFRNLPIIAGIHGSCQAARPFRATRFHTTFGACGVVLGFGPFYVDDAKLGVGTALDGLS
jgi:hypothetical protein